MSSVLSAVLGYGVTSIDNIKLNWIGKLIQGLIEGIGIVGVGIIVFTLVLKSIVLPLDIYSRINGKKQALVMERMRPQMEKLQKQYANDKNMYNQKVMELQRASGYSMFGACLPMIVSLVIFIIVFNAFSTYSQFANLKSYNDMVEVYNGVVNSYVCAIEDGEGNVTTNQYGFLSGVDEDGNPTRKLAEIEDYTVDYAKFVISYNHDKGTSYSTEAEVFAKIAADYKSSHEGYDGAFDTSILSQTESDGVTLTFTAVEARNTLVSYYLEGPAANAVKQYYEGGHNNKFLWVKNLWYPDSTLNREIPDFSKFKSSIAKASIGDDYEVSYNKVTAALDVQKGSYNGYFILIVLSIGLMLLQQFISMRANKSVNDLGTVDGSGARTNKWMLVLMPVIYGIFSFFYSASFSIYMIVNTVYGLATMLIINKSVDSWFKKMEREGRLEEVLNKRKRAAVKTGARRKK